jgi:hypothetical protein
MPDTVQLLSVVRATAYRFSARSGMMNKKNEGLGAELGKEYSTEK